MVLIDVNKVKIFLFFSLIQKGFINRFAVMSMVYCFEEMLSVLR